MGFCGVSSAVSIDGSRRSFCSVQEALIGYFAEEVVVCETACEKCTASSRRFQKSLEVVEYPQVLVLGLNRWNDDLLCLHHNVRADETIVFKGKVYHLQSHIVHLGSSARSGHYIAMAKHESSNEAWWVYDDSVRRVAAADECDGTGTFDGVSMKTYVLFYQREEGC